MSGKQFGWKLPSVKSSFSNGASDIYSKVKPSIDFEAQACQLCLDEKSSRRVGWRQLQIARNDG